MNRRTANAFGSLGLGKTPSLAALLEDLSTEQVAVRNYARSKLVAMGDEAVPALIDTLEHANVYARAQAAKALGKIGDPAGAPALVKALEDARISVHLMAGEALIRLGKPALPALLNALRERPTSPWLQRGAHIVLRAAVHEPWSDQVKPVVDALNSADADAGIAAAAQQVLDALRASEDER
jgi:HEAT repeat protein